MTTTTYPHTPGWKSTQPETSRAAARSATDHAHNLRQECEQALAGHDMTADEVAQELGQSILSVRPRISELVALGRVRATDTRRINSSGKSAVVWALKRDWEQQDLFTA